MSSLSYEARRIMNYSQPISFMQALYLVFAPFIKLNRDMFLTPGQLRGYYWLAEKLVPRMQKSDSLCKYMKKHLVDHLIRYGEYKLDLTEKKPSIMDRVTSNIFLAVIKTIGFAIPKYVRINGEVY
jgi:hypothetical protein